MGFSGHFVQLHSHQCCFQPGLFGENKLRSTDFQSELSSFTHYTVHVALFINTFYRYCYGGMRKKVEVKPPYLPDLTDEALGLTAPSGLGHSTTSPASSSGASGDASQRRLTSTSPLIRLLQTSESATDGSAWADETSIRSVLGVRGPVIVDVAHILLEYAQQVLGMQFQSLFHLAQHLVSYRYVNSRSRYAFSLIAHAANAQSTSCSPPPTAVLAETLQKGTFSVRDVTILRVYSICTLVLLKLLVYFIAFFLCMKLANG